MPDEAEAAADAPPTPEAKPKKPMGTGTKIVLAIVAVVALVIAGGAIWLFQPNKPRDYEEDVSFAHTNANTLLYGAVYGVGVDNPFVDVDDDRALIAYDWEASRANASWIALQQNRSASDPEVVNQTETPDDLQRIVIGAAANAVPDVRRLVVVQVDHTDTGTQWEVATADVLAFLKGDLSVDDFEARITKTPVAP